MYRAILVSVFLHTILAWSLGWEGFWRMTSHRAVYKSKKQIKLYIVENMKPKSHNQKMTHLQDSQKLLSRNKLRGSYADLLASSYKFTSREGGIKIYSNEFKRESEFRGAGMKLSNDLSLMIPVPLFLRRLKGYESSEVVMKRCSDKNRWSLYGLKGDRLLRAYLYERVIKETLFADNFLALQAVKYNQIKISLTYITREHESEENYSVRVDDNHYMIYLYSTKGFKPDLGFGYDYFSHEIKRKLPPAINPLKILVRKLGRLFKEENPDRFINPDTRMTLEGKIDAVIHNAIRRLKRSEAFHLPRKAEQAFSCES